MKPFRCLPVLLFFSVNLLAQQGPENLGEAVNSEFAELHPVISPDGKMLYFTRSGHPQNTVPKKGSQDVWFSENQGGYWTLARRMPAPVNREEYNTLYSITPDGNTILTNWVDHDGGDVTIRGFAVIKKTGGGWGQPQKLAIPGLENLSRGRFETAFLANDGKTLLMAFSTKKGSDEDDLYVSAQDKKGVWSKPVNLGRDVNTDKFTETTPFLASDGVTLYFSSNRDGGLGSNDIYVTRRLDNTYTKWTRPINVGPPVNTPEYDAYYSVAAAGDYAYLVTYREGRGKADIVRMKIRRDQPAEPTEAPPTVAQTVEKPRPASAASAVPEKQSQPVVLMKGKLLDPKTKKVPAGARIVYESLPDGTELGQATPDPITGEYQLVLPYGKKYGITAKAPGFVAPSQNLDLSQPGGYLELNDRNIAVQPIEAGQTVRLNNIFFVTGKYDLQEESFPELNRVVELMAQNPKLVIEIDGHTDNVGGDASNQTLSQNRASAVREYLLGKGVSAARIAAKGFGESKPVATNDTDEGRQLNRRVEFVIVKN